MAAKREMVIFTPEVAQSYLDTININRDPTQSWEDLHVQQMTDGEWDDDITIVYFNEHGELVDCAKRLRALIRAGQTREWLVISGVRETAQEKMDCGEIRTVAQDLQMKGIHNPNEKGAIGRVIWDWKERDTRGIGAGHRPPPRKIVHMVLNNRQGFANAVPVAKRIKKELPALNVPVVGAVHYLLSTKHPNTLDSDGNVVEEGLATRFFGDFEFPPRTEPGNPGRVLNTYMKRRVDDPPSKTACLWLILKAWQRYLQYQSGGSHMRASELTYPGGKRTVSIADIPRIDDL